MTAIDYAARVAKGAALLDEKMPGWVDRIDLETLDVSSSAHCMAAQATGVGNWAVGMRRLGLLPWGDFDVDHGFNAEGKCGCMPADYDQDAAYATLTQLWREVIQDRRKAAVAAPEVALAA